LCAPFFGICDNAKILAPTGRGRHRQQFKYDSLQIGEFGLEGLNRLVLLEEAMTTWRFEQLQNLVRRRGMTRPLFWIKRMELVFRAFIA